MPNTISTSTLEKLLSQAVSAAAKAAVRIMEVYKSGNFQVNLKSDSTPLTIADRDAHDIIRTNLYETRIPMLSEEGRPIHYDERRDWDYFWLVDPLDGTKEFIKINGEFTVNIALIGGTKAILGVVLLPVSATLYFALRDAGSYKIDGFDLHAPPEACSFGQLVKQAQRLPLPDENRRFTVVGSRSHLAPQMADYIEKLRQKHADLEIIARGSSLKICMVAEGRADLYPRISPTSEWDTAAGQAVAEAAGMEIVNMDTLKPLEYNKMDLTNPPFVVRTPGLEIPRR